MANQHGELDMEEEYGISVSKLMQGPVKIRIYTVVSFNYSYSLCDPRQSQACSETSQRR